MITLLAGSGAAIMPTHPTQHPEHAVWSQALVADDVIQTVMGLAIDSALQAHVVFARGGVNYAGPSLVGWVEENIAPGAAFPDIALDANGQPHVAYIPGLGMHTTNYATRSGSGWSIEPIDTTQGGGFNIIRIDPFGTPHVVYNGGAGLRHAWREESGWASELVCPNALAYFGFDLDTDGAAHAVCQEVGSTLHYVTNAGGSWATTMIPAAGGFPDLAVDSVGGVHVAFQSTAGRLGYSKLSGGVWLVESADSGSWTGRFASIDVDSDDRPHISYGDQYGTNSLTGAKTHYATRLDDGTWSRSFVGPVGWTAFNSELRIGADDAPQILYSLGYTQGVQMAVDRLVLAKPLLASAPGTR